MEERRGRHGVGSASSRVAAAGWLLLAGSASSCSMPLRVNVGTVSQGGEQASVTVCTLAKRGWCAQDMPRLAMSATSECDTIGKLWVAVVAPQESRVSEELPVRLPGGTPTAFDGPCFPKPRADRADVVVTVRATCVDGAPRATVRCEMP